jgi:hypothetical protein
VSEATEVFFAFLREGSCSGNPDITCFMKPEISLPFLVERLLPEVVFIQFVSPDDEHYVLATWREL